MPRPSDCPLPLGSFPKVKSSSCSDLSASETNLRTFSPVNRRSLTATPKKNNRTASKIACAFQALKCSSRATEEDNGTIRLVDLSDEGGEHADGTVEFPLQFEQLSPEDLERQLLHTFPRNTRPVQSAHSPRSSGNSWRTSIPANHHLAIMGTNEEWKDHSVQNSAYVSDDSNESDSSSRLLQLAGGEAIDHTPFEDTEEDAPVRYLAPQRNSSEDTSDTPNTSNRDTSIRERQPPLPLNIGAEHNSSFDEFCQTHFNTPMHIRSQGSLGDSITPLGSPETDHHRDEDEHDLPESRIPNTANTILQIPTMTSPRELSVVSSGSSLFGEVISDGRKPVDCNATAHRRLTLEPEHAKMQIGRQELRAASTSKATSSPKPENITLQQPPGTNPSGVYCSLKHEDSSYSSVSSFADISGYNKRNSASKSSSNKTLTPHPFFWRSHPGIVNQSRGKQQEFHDSRSHTFYAAPRPSAVHNKFRRESIEKFHAPYLDPGVVRKMWMDSKPFGLQVNTNWKVNSNSSRHPQGPPSTRSAAFIQSLTSFATTNLPSVFVRSESTRLSPQQYAV